MSFFRYIPLLLLAAAAVGYWGLSMPWFLQVPKQTPPPDIPDSQAQQTFADCRDSLHPQRLPWIRADFTQRVRAGELTYTTKGWFASGPAGEFHLELTARSGNSKSGHVQNTGMGLRQLLDQLGKNAQWVRQDTIRRGKAISIKLVGRLTPAAEYAPTECRLYLIPDSLWPHRMEWWGPSETAGSHVMLVEMEFRERAGD